MDANKPIMPDGRTYHLQTREGDLAKHCLLVGSPERAEMISRTMFSDAELVGDHRGLKSFTGKVDGVPMSVVTTGMGSASTAIVLPEAVYSGAQRLIRVGSCSTLWPEPRPGESAICTGAVRLDGASKNWAPIEYPAVADFRVVNVMVEAAQELGLPHHVGIGVTTTCFNEGQARPDISGYLPPRLQVMHEELVRRGVLFYSMESSTRWRRRRCSCGAPRTARTSGLVLWTPSTATATPMSSRFVARRRPHVSPSVRCSFSTSATRSSPATRRSFIQPIQPRR